ncbi:hypothetical protein JYU34_014782 [Plutella xylostella]|uniref:Uncharacterized protein n=1 Tax=Plutella xylostella TaxID=51655 RepID=A0ABQ7Q958_PLUXY|nr:hypothetical protein JYU34_014782 [Plutella xylostella]
MTFGLFAGEEESGRYLVLEEKTLRIVSRYWEVFGAAPAERQQIGNRQRLLVAPFGLL